MANSSSDYMRSRTNIRAGADKADPYNVTVQNIRQDLSERSGDDPPGDRPIWPFSAYAPGRDAPRQLLEGQLEQSPEEMRVQFYLAQAAGRPQEYIQQEETLLTQVKQQVEKILSDPVAAKQYVLDGANIHPNRIDQCQSNAQSFPSSAPARSPAPAQPTGTFGQSSSFGASSVSGSAFGQPSGLGASKPAFGAPSSMGTGSAFGAPSALGGAGGFGKPSALGAGASAFGQASSLGQSNPFGGAQKPAAFGQATQSGVAAGFGKPTQPAFGQSAFGAPAAVKPAFGAASQPGAFGQPGAAPAFGSASKLGTFGQSVAGSAFGQASQPGQSVFGQSSQPGTFGGQQTQSQTGGSAFGSPSPFGAAAQKPSPFATAAQNPPQTNSPFAAASNKPSPFTTAAQNTQQPTPANPFAKPGGSFGNSLGNSGTASNPPVGGPTSNTTAPSGTTQRTLPTHWQGRPLVRDEKGNPCTAVTAPTAQDPQHQDYTRIWFAEGPPLADVHNPTALRDPEAPPEMYEGRLGEALKGLYEFAMREGTFREGVMPELPPKREWIDFEV